MVSNRNLCGAAKTLHGRETRAILAKRQQALAGLKLIKRMGKGVGVAYRGEVRLTMDDAGKSITDRDRKLVPYSRNAWRS